jgi:hypothetical protein
VLAARYQYDKHVVKMVLETAQLLSTTVAEYGLPTEYRPTHVNHPSRVWAGRSIQNFEWLRKHGIALGTEYLNRYGRYHKSVRVITRLPTPDIPDHGFFPPPQAMPDEYKCDDTVLAYRRYYVYGKTALYKYTWPGEHPHWYNDITMER